MHDAHLQLSLYTSEYTTYVDPERHGSAHAHTRTEATATRVTPGTSTRTLMRFHQDNGRDSSAMRRRLNRFSLFIDVKSGVRKYKTEFKANMVSSLHTLYTFLVLQPTRLQLQIPDYLCPHKHTGYCLKRCSIHWKKTHLLKHLLQYLMNLLYHLAQRCQSYKSGSQQPVWTKENCN